ncbi:hypothetical protein, partial [Paraburkholderia hospita]|uniref:hypothetical protein n=1 Tax=Paraburkholderia hospita TaxID=169430 RepID=UPI001A9863E1
MRPHGRAAFGRLFVFVGLGFLLRVLLLVWFWFCVGISRWRLFAARAVWLFWPLRWHPRFAFVLQALPVGVFGLCAGIRVLLAWFKRRP